VISTSGPVFPLTEVITRALEIGRGPRRTYPRDSPVHELVAARAAQRPDAVALRNGLRTLTYAELMTRSRRLSDHLLQHGIGAGAERLPAHRSSFRRASRRSDRCLSHSMDHRCVPARSSRARRHGA
jgi:non-ribosomal peptide synthetase component F